jgi:hypothetical protein
MRKVRWNITPLSRSEIKLLTGLEARDSRNFNKIKIASTGGGPHNLRLAENATCIHKFDSSGVGSICNNNDIFASFYENIDMQKHRRRCMHVSEFGSGVLFNTHMKFNAIRLLTFSIQKKLP